MEEKYSEKTAKYLLLSKEIRMLWHLQEVRILPIIIGCLGTYRLEMKKQFRGLDIDISGRKLQTVTITESIKMMLQQSEKRELLRLFYLILFKFLSALLLAGFFIACFKI